MYIHYVCRRILYWFMNLNLYEYKFVYIIIFSYNILFFIIDVVFTTINYLTYLLMYTLYNLSHLME